MGDPTEVSHWRPLRQLLVDLDDDIERLCVTAGVEGFKPSWVMELIRLHVREPLTITVGPLS